MKNRIRGLMVTALVVSLPCAAFAQGASNAGGGQFEPGTKLLSAGLLVGGTGDYAGIGASAAFEIGVAKFGDKVTLGVGASVGYIHDSFGSFYSYSVDQIPIFFIANGHYQLTQIPKLDLYGGVSLGVAHVSYSYDNGYCAGCDNSNTDVAGGVQIGGRWAFSDSFSGMVQLGEGVRVPIVTAGVSIKF